MNALRPASGSSSATQTTRVIVARVDADSDLPVGARVLEWNGIAIEEARLDASTECLSEGIATLERLAFEQLRFLTRGAVGDTATLLTDAGEHALVATDDDDEAFEAFEHPAPGGTHTVHHRTEGLVGVISSEGGLRSQARMRKAIGDFEEAGVEGVILDLRGNTGGSDPLAALLGGFFNDEARFYQHEAYRGGRRGFRD